MCIWNLKTMPVNNEDAHLFTQNVREKLVIFEALCKSLPCFQCSWNLQGIFIHNIIDLGIVKFIKNLSSGFLNEVNFVGMDQITCKTCNKNSWMQVSKLFFLLAIAQNDSPLFFVRSFQWNQTTMRWSRISKAYHFLKIFANCVYSMLFHCFYDS